MGYDFHITRANTWLESHLYPITKAEWDAIVASDSELETSADCWVERNTANGVERTYDTVWIAHPDHVPFWWQEGEIKTKNADQATRRKMVEIASRLNARVVGDEGEEYGIDGASLPQCAVCGATAHVHLKEMRHRFLWFFPYKIESHFCSQHIPPKLQKTLDGSSRQPN